jgi:hypothetical protein
MNAYELIRPLGILTYASILIAVWSGVRHWKLKHHMALAGLSLLLASLHALIVLGVL